MTEIPFYLVAAFSDQPFAGNPAAVCLLKKWLPDELLLKMAQQHNQSETAFFVANENGFELRWFTTQGEINLCGHATLAAAHVIFEHLDYPDTKIHFATRFVGPLTVTRSGEWLTLDFPAWQSESRNLLRFYFQYRNILWACHQPCCMNENGHILHCPDIPNVPKQVPDTA